jgi:hypothetical protein
LFFKMILTVSPAAQLIVAPINIVQQTNRKQIALRMEFFLCIDFSSLFEIGDKGEKTLA